MSFKHNDIVSCFLKVHFPDVGGEGGEHRVGGFAVGGQWPMVGWEAGARVVQEQEGKA